MGDGEDLSACGMERWSRECSHCEKPLGTFYYMTCPKCFGDFHYTCADADDVEDTTWQCVECYRKFVFDNFDLYRVQQSLYQDDQVPIKAAVRFVDQYIGEVKKSRSEGAALLERLFGVSVKLATAVDEQKAKLKNLEEKLNRVRLENKELKETIHTINKEN